MRFGDLSDLSDAADPFKHKSHRSVETLRGSRENGSVDKATFEPA